METPLELLSQGISAGAYPGATAWLSRGGETVFHAAVGTRGIEAPFGDAVTTDTLYDLASVTKMYTLTVTLLVAHHFGIDLERDSVARYFPEFPENVSLVHLLQHTSGLGVEIQALEKVEAGDWIGRIAKAPLRFEPGAQVLYSCTNYFMLARLAEKVAGTSFDALLDSYLIGPSGWAQTTLEPTDLSQVAPTEVHPEVGYWLGVVHDEAARSWRAQTGHCAGNAGLFASVGDVAKFGRLWLEENEILPGAALKSVWSRPVPENSYQRAWGWQVDAAFYMGDFAPPETSGHLGFTGPALVLNRHTGHLAVMLSNRVHPTRTGPDRLPFYRQLNDWFFQFA